MFETCLCIHVQFLCGVVFSCPQLPWSCYCCQVITHQYIISSTGSVLCQILTVPFVFSHPVQFPFCIILNGCLGRIFWLDFFFFLFEIESSIIELFVVFCMWSSFAHIRHLQCNIVSSIFPAIIVKTTFWPEPQSIFCTLIKSQILQINCVYATHWTNAIQNVFYSRTTFWKRQKMFMSYVRLLL